MGLNVEVLLVAVQRNYWLAQRGTGIAVVGSALADGRWEEEHKNEPWGSYMTAGAALIAEVAQAELEEVMVSSSSPSQPTLQVEAARTNPCHPAPHA